MEEEIKTIMNLCDDKSVRVSFDRSELDLVYELCGICRSLDMELTTDDMADIYATIPGDTSLKSIVIGCHLDRCCSEKYNDSLFGVICALKVCIRLVREKIFHKHPITIMIWSDSEGERFKKSLLSSGIICGSYNKNLLIDIKDNDDVSLEEVVEASGYMGSVENRMNDMSCMAYIEMHYGKDSNDEKYDAAVITKSYGRTHYKCILKLKKPNGKKGTGINKYKSGIDYSVIKSIDEGICKKFLKLRNKVDYTIHSVMNDIDKIKFKIDIMYTDKKLYDNVTKIISSILAKFKRYDFELIKELDIEPAVYDDNIIQIIESNLTDYKYKKIQTKSLYDIQNVSQIIKSGAVFINEEDSQKKNISDYKKRIDKGVSILLNTVLDIDKKNY